MRFLNRKSHYVFFMKNSQSYLELNEITDKRKELYKLLIEKKEDFF